MSRNSYLLLLGGGRRFLKQRMPKAYTQMAAAVLENPVAMVAFVVADSQCRSPVSELAVNGCALDIDQGTTPMQGVAIDVIGAEPGAAAARNPVDEAVTANV